MYLKLHCHPEPVEGDIVNHPLLIAARAEIKYLS